MDFNNISKLLEKFRNLQPSDSLIKDAFITIAHDRYSIIIDPKEIKVQKSVLYITAHPAVKSELNIHKKELLDTLNTKLEKQTITNIV